MACIEIKTFVTGFLGETATIFYSLVSPGVSHVGELDNWVMNSWTWQNRAKERREARSTGV